MDGYHTSPASRRDASPTRRCFWSCGHSDSLGLPIDRNHGEKRVRLAPTARALPRMDSFGIYPHILAVRHALFILEHWPSIFRRVRYVLELSSLVRAFPQRSALDRRPQLATYLTASTSTVSSAVVTSLAAFYEFSNLYPAAITNKGAAWTLLHSLSNFIPPQRNRKEEEESQPCP